MNAKTNEVCQVTNAAYGKYMYQLLQVQLSLLLYKRGWLERSK